MKYLLDVNVLIAAVWGGHSLNSRVQEWLADKPIVLCPISALGFIRISTNPKAIGADMGKAREALKRFIETAKAESIPADLDVLNSHPRTTDEVTDHYLADLAKKHGMKLVTLDEELDHPSAELVSG